MSALPRAEIILGLPGLCQSRLHPLILAPSVPMCCPDPVRYDAHTKTKQVLGVGTSSCPGTTEELCHVAVSQERALGARTLRGTWALLRKEEMGSEESASADGSSPPPIAQ